jgi:hypothetical protein
MALDPNLPRHRDPGVDHLPLVTWLVRMLGPAIVVEHRQATGNSSFDLSWELSAAFPTLPCYAIETWEGALDSHLAAAGFTRRTHCSPDLRRWLRLPLKEAQDHFADSSIDMLIVDGRIRCDEARGCFDTWLPKLNNAAVVLFPGTSNGSGQRYWSTVRQRYPLSLEFTDGDGLGVLQLAPGEGRTRLEWLVGGTLALSSGVGARSDKEDGNTQRDLVTEMPNTLSSAPRQDLEVATLRYALAVLEKEATQIPQLRQALAERDAQLENLSEAAAQRDAMLASTSWRITRPLRLLVGLLRGNREVRHRGSSRCGRMKEELQDAPSSAPAADPADSKVGHRGFSDRNRLDATTRRPTSLTIYPDPSPSPMKRLTVICDDLVPHDVFSGLATAMVFAAMLAQHQGLRLRLVTLEAAPLPSQFGALLASMGIDYPGNPDFEYAPALADTGGIGVVSRELILTTSWRATWTALLTFDRSRIVYFVREDDPAFRVCGEAAADYRQILRQPQIRCVVHSSTLSDRLIADGLIGSPASRVVLEPVFPERRELPVLKQTEDSAQFLFYALPGTPRTLVLLGLAAVEHVFSRLGSAATDWEFRLVGEDLPESALSLAVKVERADRLPWTPDCESLSRVDASLILTGAPSRALPTLALAAGGAVVVSTSDQPLAVRPNPCGNILFSDPTLDDLTAVIAHAVALARDLPSRRGNYERAHFLRDWDQSLVPVFEALKES